MDYREVPCTNQDTQLQEVIRMKGGEGETSYARNSLIQQNGMLNAKYILQESIKELICTSFKDAECIKVANLGCSSGPNALLPILLIIEVVYTSYLNRTPPMLQAFLNDLPGNDFNTIFKSLPGFYKQLKKDKGSNFGPFFIAGVPGSFYERLFPNQTLHFVYSSYSLHWLSKVPQGLVSESGTAPLNKDNIYITRTSPPSVHKAYLDQFERDFKAFLKLRWEEMMPRGRMVLLLLAADQNNFYADKEIMELYGNTLSEMVAEGLVEESKLELFNLPYYAPSILEAKDVVESEGSFTIHGFETFPIEIDALNTDDKHVRAKFIARSTRAVVESLLTSHFGDAVMDTFFDRFTQKMADHLEAGKAIGLSSLVISLAKGP